MKIKHFALLPLLALLLSISGAFAGLEEIKARGELKVALYKEFPPFSDDGKGIDVDIAAQLAQKLGVKLDILWFEAGEEVGDDLRNFVWKGHYLGYGIADVMLHVPVDPVFADRNKNTSIFAPYYRESPQVARNLERIPQLPGLDIFTQQKIGVETGTGADLYLLSAQGGKLRSNVVHYKTTQDAIAALKKGEVSAVMANRTELEAGLNGAGGGFAVEAVRAPGLPNQGWNLGAAVKTDNPELTQALEKIFSEMLKDGTIRDIFKKHGINYSPPL
ncbi:MAG: substrate-binding periplasmic protein [Burkholderiales bacterium]